LAPNCIYIDVLRGVETYSESALTGEVQGERRAGGAAFHKGIHKKTSDLVGDSPQFVSVTAEEFTAQAWHTACAFAGRKVSAVLLGRLSDYAWWAGGIRGSSGS
jgi:hypothetical protein